VGGIKGEAGGGVGSSVLALPRGSISLYAQLSDSIASRRHATPSAIIIGCHRKQRHDGGFRPRLLTRPVADSDDPRRIRGAFPVQIAATMRLDRSGETIGPQVGRGGAKSTHGAGRTRRKMACANTDVGNAKHSRRYPSPAVSLSFPLKAGPSGGLWGGTTQGQVGPTGCRMLGAA